MFYAKVQGKVNTNAKIKKSKSMWKMVWLNSWNNCSEMFWKIAVLNFLEKHAWWRPLLPRCAACSLELYWRPTPPQVCSWELFKIGDNSNSTHWTNITHQYLTNINSKVLLYLMTYDAHHFSIWSFWHLFPFSFPVRSFFLPWKTLNPDHGLNCLIPKTIFPELKNYLIWYLFIETSLRQNWLRILWKYLQ